MNEDEKKKKRQRNRVQKDTKKGLNTGREEMKSSQTEESGIIRKVKKEESKYNSNFMWAPPVWQQDFGSVEYSPPVTTFQSCTSCCRAIG